MNPFCLLIDNLPAYVNIAGQQVALETNFRTGILCELLLWDEEGTAEEKAVGILNLFYGGHDTPAVQAAPEEALEKALWFYRAGLGDDKPKLATVDEGLQEDGENCAVATSERLYDFVHDGPLIYAAFLADYGVDLTHINLHWWIFRAMMAGLRSDNLFCRVLAFRDADTSTMQGEEKAYYNRMKKRWALPQSPTQRQQCAEFARVLAGNGDLASVVAQYGTPPHTAL